ncbi:MAG: energy-coupling factor transporter transmembrane component T family protein [Chloroflexota bacterium]|jgi:cobalt/nickel transport system permease protein
MDIGTIDYWAVGRSSPLHKASALSKVIAAGLLVASVIVTWDIFALLGIYLFAAAGIVLACLPVLRVLAVALYPAIFALLFAVSQWDGSLLGPLLVVGRALAAAAVMVTLIATTPYPQLFAVLRFVLPTLVADALFITYRSLFILLGLFGYLMTSLRLRGGLSKHRFIHNARNLATGLGLMLVRSVALAERLYDVLRLRGYSGRLTGGTSWRQFTKYDTYPLAASSLILAAVLVLRFVPGAYLYNGYLLLAAVLTLAAAALARLRCRRAMG